jgi:hypothetical protein
MRKYLGISLLLAAACFFPGRAHAAAPPADQFVGHVVIDAGRHGEAWYVNPQTRMKVFLGRPADALERLTARSVPVHYAHVDRLADVGAAMPDPEYAKSVAGFVLAPNDLIGAAWYVTPDGHRQRLATPADAWNVMRAGVPLPSGAIDAIPTEPKPADRFVVAKVKDIASGDTLTLDDGRTVKILNVDVPANPVLQDAAKAKIAVLVKAGTVLLERDVDDKDAAGRLLRHVHVGTQNVGYDLVRSGLAFTDFGDTNWRHAELMIVGSIDAAREKKGFWNPESPK